MGAVRSPWSDVTIPEDVSCCQLILARANSEPDRLALVSIEGVTVGLYQTCMVLPDWFYTNFDGGVGRSSIILLKGGGQRRAVEKPT